tara:strand:+ start:2758 stop:2979 length:222 start_codon:yes stop_codon:yes gene_type:complete
VKKEAVVDMLGAAAIMICIVVLCITTLGKNEHLLAVSDCVDTKWEEFESRTGEMPSQPLEQMWWRECAKELEG